MHSTTQQSKMWVFSVFSDNFTIYENKFHKLHAIGAILIDLMKIIAQYEKKNYMVCDGRSAL